MKPKKLTSHAELAKNTRAIDVIESRIYDSSEATDVEDAFYRLLEKLISDKSIYEILDKLSK